MARVFLLRSSLPPFFLLSLAPFFWGPKQRRDMRRGLFFLVCLFTASCWHGSRTKWKQKWWSRGVAWSTCEGIMVYDSTSTLDGSYLMSYVSLRRRRDDTGETTSGLSVVFFSERTIFFSHNKLMNSIFLSDFLAKRIWPALLKS
jgi:hypothetical protein